MPGSSPIGLFSCQQPNTRTGHENPDLQVGEETHEESSESSDGSGGSDEISLNLGLADSIGRVVHTPPIHLRICRADASSSTVGDDAAVDGNNVPATSINKPHTQTKIRHRIWFETYDMAKKVARPARISVKK